MRNMEPWLINRYCLVSLYAMYEFLLERFCSATRYLALARETLENFTDQNELLPQEDQRVIAEWLNRMRQECEPLCLKASLGQIERLLSNIEHSSVNNIGHGIADLGMRMRDETERMRFLYISPDLQRFYTDPEDIYGDAVLGKFHDARRDIQEAAKCLALERSTASVYHSMRIAEHGLRHIAKRVGITVSKSVRDSWGQLITQIEHKITSKMQRIPIGSRNARRRNTIQFYSEAAQHMRHFKEAWRDDIAHARSEYTQEEARKVFDAVRHFMQLLANLSH